jgi:hypothetical protein
MGTHVDSDPRPSRDADAAGRGPLRRALARHPRRIAVVAVAGLVLTVPALLWFEPWQIFLEQSVNEALPGSSESAPAAEAGESSAGSAGGKDESGQPNAAPAVKSVGPFRSLEHETTGRARILELDVGRRFVRLEDFRTSNGPDLVVLLSDTPATEDSWGAYDDGRTILLGELKGNTGNQNYGIPPDVELSQFDSVVIWCRRFTVGFGAAPIQP